MFKVIIIWFVFLSLTACEELGDQSRTQQSRKVACPEGYIEVPLESDSLAPFCVMKWEAKAWKDLNGNNIIDEDDYPATNYCNNISSQQPVDCLDEGYQVVSSPYGQPWEKVQASYGDDLCGSLNSESSDEAVSIDLNKDGTFALISNDEWMAIAANIQNIDANWTSGKVGDGCIFGGNSGVDIYRCGGNAVYMVATGVVGSPLNSADFGTDRNEKARHFLSNGEEIWDFSGNVSEVVDMDATKTEVTGLSPSDLPYSSADGGYSFNNIEWTDLDRNITIPLDRFAPPGMNHADHGIGMYMTRDSHGQAEYAIHRGGSYSTNPYAGGVTGIYGVIAHAGITSGMTGAGFRCVFRGASK